MGRCHEFGSQIREGCGHPMRAGRDSCSCPECGVVCEGQFDGCPDVWARGPRLVRAPDPEPSVNPSVPLAGSGEPAAPAAATSASRSTAVSGSRSSDSPGPVEQVVSLGRPRRMNRSGLGMAGDAAPLPSPTVRSSTTGGSPAEMPSMEEPRTEVLRWFEEAFEGLRDEMRAMAGGITQQQAMMAELMESSQADLRLIMVAESLPRLVDDAVRKALGDNSVSLLQFLDSSLGDFKDELRKREDSAREASERADAEQVAGLEAIRTAVIKELRPIARAIAQAVELQAEAKEEDAARLPALKASMTRTLRPLEEAAERSDERLAEIANQLKKLAKAGGAPPGDNGGGSVPPPRSPSGARNASVRNASVRNGGPAKTRPVSRRR